MAKGAVTFNPRTTAKDNFAPLEKLSYSILSIETVFVHHHLSVKLSGIPSRTLSA